VSNTITIRSGAAIIVEFSERIASMHLTIYQVHVCKTQYAMQILKGKYLVDKTTDLPQATDKLCCIKYTSPELDSNT
jgi:hypothetical protein